VILVIVNHKSHFGQSSLHFSKDSWLPVFIVLLVFTYYVLPVLTFVTLLINIIKKADKTFLLKYSGISMLAYALILLFDKYDPWFCFWGCIID
jgi:sulfite exporter TauE/SafE